MSARHATQPHAARYPARRRSCRHPRIVSAPLPRRRPTARHLRDLAGSVRRIGSSRSHCLAGVSGLAAGSGYHLEWNRAILSDLTAFRSQGSQGSLLGARAATITSLLMLGVPETRAIALAGDQPL